MYPDLPFEFIVPGVAVSAQASSKGKRAWKEAVCNAAMSELPEGHFVLDGRLCVTIYFFPQSQMEADIDNCAKPILDALTHTIYLDDHCVYRLVLQKFESEAPFIIGTRVSDVLGYALALSDPAVYVRVSDDLHGE